MWLPKHLVLRIAAVSDLDVRRALGVFDRVVIPEVMRAHKFVSIKQGVNWADLDFDLSRSKAYHITRWIHGMGDLFEICCWTDRVATEMFTLMYRNQDNSIQTRTNSSL
jgi:hypothetical protein